MPGNYLERNETMDSRDLEVTMLSMNSWPFHSEEHRAKLEAQAEGSFSRIEEELRRENAFRALSQALQDIQNR